jgi:hypothetical protein
MHDIIDVIKNIETLTVNDSAFKILKDFERVMDELDMYVYKNWEEGELLAGPVVSRYHVECKFMWPYEEMPDPVGGERLLDYGCKITYAKEKVLVPRKVRKPDDFRPGTKKGKIDAHPIWVVSISMPKKLMQDIFQGYERNIHDQMADHMMPVENEGLSAGNAAQGLPNPSPAESAMPDATAGGDPGAPPAA